MSSSSSVAPRSSSSSSTSTSTASPASSSSASAIPTGIPAVCLNSTMPGVSEFGSISTGFFGCVADVPAVFNACCAEVGSTPAAINDTCGCPYNAVFQFAQPDIQKFVDCASKGGATTGCLLPKTSGSVRGPEKTMGWGCFVAMILLIAGALARSAVE
ncbi:hypothetical protein B0H16DRAFT_395261 [Mycena metata]|uniref:Uncharacterized protein n=1 Tax=Mycena metata TaxID=1033252 RepID=A0AAD7HGP6_9AGAR|nr:hypothetical protein B0H16DRAFT_395261 [Mycena metata]